jgi:hypothetical protein
LTAASERAARYKARAGEALQELSTSQLLNAAPRTPSPKPKAGQAKRWSDPYDPPSIDAPIEITFVRPDYKVTIAGRERLSVKLEPDEYPLFAVKGMHLSWECEPLAEAVAVASATAEATATVGGAGAPVVAVATATATSERKSPEPTPDLVDVFLANMKATSYSSVLETIFAANTGACTTPLEKQLQIAFRQIGTKGVAAALAEAGARFKP